MRLLLLSLLVTACAVETSTTTAELTTADVWQQRGFDQAHTGVNPNETILDATNVAGLRVAWTATTGLDPGGAIVATRRAYVGSENNTLYAFRGETGQRAWRAFAGRDILSTPAAVYGRVYFLADDGLLYAVTSGTGEVEWTADVRAYPTAPTYSEHSSPVVHDGVVYVVTSSRLSAFSAHGCGAATCAELWHADLPFLVGGMWQTSPAIGKGHVYVVGGTPGDDASIDLHAYPLAGCASAPCAPTWIRTLPSPFMGYVLPFGLAYHGGRVYLATNVALYSVYADTGVRRWTRTFGCTGAPAILDGVVYQPSTTGLIALEEANVGETIWRSPAAAGPASTPAVANGVVYAALGEGARLAAFAVGCGSDGATCAPLWTDDVDGSRAQPAVAGGMVFASNALTNELRALSL